MSVLILGANGLAGSAVTRHFRKYSDKSLVCVGSRNELDLRNFSALEKLFSSNNFEGIIFCAARVGGIGANQSYPFEFLNDNVMIQSNIFELVKKYKVEKTIFLGSSCIYPVGTKLPIKEEYLKMDGVHPLHEPYAIAKMVGFKSSEYLNKEYGLDCRSLMPTNLFGANDNYHQLDSHVVPALIRKVATAVLNHHEDVVLWGTGKVFRDILFSDDLASAIFTIYNAEKTEWEKATYGGPSFLNVGSGTEHTIIEIAEKIGKILNFRGKFINDLSKPDGTQSKLLDISRIQSLGWKPEISLEKGLKKTVSDYQKNFLKLRH